MSVKMAVKPGQNPVTSITIVVEGHNLEELTSHSTRNQVLSFARANGLGNASGLGGIPTAYPVDKDGKTDEDLLMCRRPFDRFQAEYVVNAGM